MLQDLHIQKPLGFSRIVFLKHIIFCFTDKRDQNKFQIRCFAFKYSVDFRLYQIWKTSFNDDTREIKYTKHRQVSDLVNLSNMAASLMFGARGTHSCLSWKTATEACTVGKVRPAVTPVTSFLPSRPLLPLKPMVCQLPQQRAAHKQTCFAQIDPS